jgi:hypothetical protein
VDEVARALRIDQRERWRIGEPLEAETYLRHSLRSPPVPTPPSI